tara:strand:+ start:551 stop:1630 length:1080 start_codon:yes stop_codon:yes gene_type:complete
MSQTKAQILQGKGTANTVEGLTASGIVTAAAFDVGTTIQIGNAGVITATSLDVRTLGGDVNVSGAVTITGNLRVDGTQTIVNTETLDVADKTVGIGSTTNPSNTTADGGGIEVYGGADGNKSLLWAQTGEKWTLSGGALSVGSSITGSAIHAEGVITSGVTTAGGQIGVSTGNVHIGKGGAGSSNAELKLQAGASNGNDTIAFLNQAGSTRGNITYDTDNNFMMFNVNAAEQIRISSEGRVGVATAAPFATFDLIGNEVTHMVDMGSGSDIDCSLGNFFKKTVAGSVSFELINLPSQRTYSFTLLVDYSSGSITWPSVMVWPDASAPTLTSGKKHLIMGVKCPDGTNNYRMSYLVNYAS